MVIVCFSSLLIYYNFSLTAKWPVTKPLQNNNNDNDDDNNNNNNKITITAKAALKFGSEAWVLKKREEQRLEAAQMKFLRHLLGITKLDRERN